MKLIVPVATVVALAAPVAAQDSSGPAPAITISGSATLASDYRFRGVSQTDKEVAVQGGITVVHDSGLYAGVWASNLAGWGTFGGANMELDLIGGYRVPLAGGMLDVGATWYMYPGGADETDFAEPYIKLSGTTGPLTLLAGAAYAPKQQALGRWYASGADAAAGVYTDPGDKEDNLYLWGDAAAGIAGTPLTAKAHLGYSDGNPGLGPNATSLAPTGAYFDWSLGLDATWRNLTVGVAYVDTDISGRDAAYLQPSFSDGQDGNGAIAGSTGLVTVTASF
ncbi:hypothetical protein PK98_09210 [Croceibacterium mercuriale]|uniref:Porin domain-containing protein n=1 Tax=Croceibacterium mercuriale TaxID=1572751 RepID=A0A0B2C2R2_9SPHN|nr:TorF family putative porin [Croceibacterium mercuriale]KHL26552.1 hypothetical protein PK98_09210 [Croceibacterium mercuriale]